MRRLQETAPNLPDYPENILRFPPVKDNKVSAKEFREEEIYNDKVTAARKGIMKKRFYAFFTDLFAIGLIQKVLVLSYVEFVNEALHQMPFALKSKLISNVGELRLSTLLMTFFSYFFVSLYLGHGKTLGKTIFHLRVVGEETQTGDLTFFESLMRTIGYTVCYIGMVFPFALPFFRKDRKGFPDFFSQTSVITEEEFQLLQEINVQESFSPIENVKLKIVDLAGELEKQATEVPQKKYGPIPQNIQDDEEEGQLNLFKLPY